MTFSTDDGSIYLLYAFVAIPVLIIFPLVVRAVSRLRLKRLSRSSTIVTMYESPSGLTPAEIGYIYDASLKTHEFVATVFDLEYKNIIKINEQGQLSLDSVNTQSQPLEAHEKLIIRLIVSGDYKSVLQDLSIVNNQLFKQEVSRSLVNKGLIREHFYQRVFFGTLKMIRNVFFFYSSLIILSTVSLLFVSPLSVGEVLLMCVISLIAFTLLYTPLYIALGVALTFIYVKLDGMRWIGTTRLRQTWPDIEGYRMYIKQAQLNRLNFASEELRIKALEKDFSYAVVLRLKVDWRTRFKPE